jgi:hypothetical protein
MVKKILIALVLIPVLILVLAPKKQLYFMLQKQLAAQDIMITNGNINENPFGLSIEHPELYYKGIKVAEISNITLWTVLAYTHGNIDSVMFDPSLKSYLPEKIQNISFTHSVIKPLEASLAIKDNSMKGSGTANIKGKMFKFHFTKLPPKSPISVYLKSNKGGWDYERRF